MDMKRITLVGGKMDGAVLDVAADVKLVKIQEETYLPEAKDSLVFKVQ